MLEKLSFADAVQNYGTDLSAGEFNDLMDLLTQWGVERCKNKHREKRK